MFRVLDTDVTDVPVTGDIDWRDDDARRSRGCPMIGRKPIFCDDGLRWPGHPDFDRAGPMPHTTRREVLSHVCRSGLWRVISTGARLQYVDVICNVGGAS